MHGPLLSSPRARSIAGVALFLAVCGVADLYIGATTERSGVGSRALQQQQQQQQPSGTSEFTTPMTLDDEGLLQLQYLAGGGNVTFRLTLTGLAWVGFGLATESGQMLGCEVVIGRLDDKADRPARPYTLESYTIAGVYKDEVAVVTGLTWEHTEARSVLEFTRTKNNGGALQLS